MVSRPAPEAREPNEAPAPADPRRPLGRRVVLTPLTLFLVLLLAYVLVKVRFVVILVLLSFVFATAIERPVRALQRRHIPRGFSILIVYIVLVGAIALLAALTMPELIHQTRAFTQDAPDRLRHLQADWAASSNPLLSGAGQRAIGRAIEAIKHPPVKQQAAVGIATTVTGAVVGFFAMLVMTFYYLMERQLLRGVVLDELAPKPRERVERVWNDVEAKVGDWLRGQVLLMVVTGISATIFFAILGIPFWPLLGVLSGVTALIPLLGPWLSGIPAVTMALTQSWKAAALVVVFILVRQFVSDFMLAPKIMNNAVGLTPLTVILAILAGTALLGPVGALLAIPIAAAVQVIVADWLQARRAAVSEQEREPLGWRWLRGAGGLGEPRGGGNEGSSGEDG